MRFSLTVNLTVKILGTDPKNFYRQLKTARDGKNNYNK
jgi:hypothetical protein